jgi:universal stress protein F
MVFHSGVFMERAGASRVPELPSTLVRFLKMAGAMKKLLVALDSSTRAPLVLAAARLLAGQLDARIVAYRAVGIPPELPRDLLTLPEVSFEEALLRNARASLQQLVGDDPLIERVVVELATPWDGICRAAVEYAADLVVLGSHGYHGLDKLLGTTAAKVVNHTNANVFIVRKPL